MKRKKLTAIITIILIVILAFFVYKDVSIEKNKKDEYQEYTPQEEISDEQSRQTKVTLYFQNIETGELDTEAKIIDANMLLSNPEKELMNLLIKGPQNNNLKKLIPDGTILHDIKIDKSCAIKRNVNPYSICSFLKRFIICACIDISNDAIGSSAIIKSGSTPMLLAIAIRCL